MALRREVRRIDADFSFWAMEARSCGEAGVKKRKVLAKKFKCPFCGHEKSVSCSLDYKLNTGTLNCKNCDEKFVTPITYLSKSVDVYFDWIDHIAAENAAEEEDEEEEAGAEAATEGAAAALYYDDE